MSKAKRSAPTPAIRDAAGRFVKGQSGNRTGRAQIPQEIKQFCKEKSMRWLLKLDMLGDREDTQAKDLIAIARLFLEYGYGRPAAEYDRERLDLETKRVELEGKRVDADMLKQDADSGQNSKIEVIISGEAKGWGE